jgi:predicted RNase H-like HicB family nuclease
MKRSYMVIYERAAEDNWGAWVPDVGGAVGAGDSFDQVRESVRQGIAIQLEYLVEQGLEVPPAVCKVVDLSEFEPGPHYEIEWMTVDLPSVHDHTEDLAKQAA